MSALNFGEKLCGPGPEENGCLCPACQNFRKEQKDVPKGCSPHACGNCDPDRVEPDDDDGYGPMRECSLFKERKRCANCKWYEPCQGVCCNGASPEYAAFLCGCEICKKWEAKQE